MAKKKLLKIIVLLAFFTLSGMITLRLQAENSNVTVTADKATASVSVKISDSSLEGKNISVVCYNPQWNGSFSSWSSNQKYVVYLNQYKVSGITEFSFKVNEQPADGEYSLVIGSENGKSVQKFKFVTTGSNTDPTTNPTTNPTLNPTAEPTSNPTETNKLPAPKSLKAVQSGTKRVKLTWNKVAGAKSYDVYRSAKASSGFKKIGSAATTSYQDKNASAGKTWYYKVMAIGSTLAANSNQSNAVKVLVLGAPSIQVKSSGKRVATVTWKKVKGAKGYKVYVATKKSGKYKERLTLKGASKSKGVVKNLQSGKTYYIKARAYTTVNGKNVLGKYSKTKSVKIR